MAYIGNSAANQTFTPVIDTFNGNGSTTAFTLTYPVASVAQVEAYISNVPQQPGVAYTVLGNTITFTSAPPSGTANIYVRYTSPITQIMQPGQGTVGTTQLMDSAVTAAKVASGQILPAAGITFPATQSASSDANTLDDYEEGTWTPTLVTDMGVSASYTTQYGKYTKIGNVVYVEAGIVWTAFSGSGNVQIGGFPFQVVLSNPAKAISISLSASTNTGLVNYSLSDYRTTGSYSALYIYSFGGNVIQTAGVGASGTICFKGFYFI